MVKKQVDSNRITSIDQLVVGAKYLWRGVPITIDDIKDGVVIGHGERIHILHTTHLEDLVKDNGR